MNGKPWGREIAVQSRGWQVEGGGTLLYSINETWTLDKATGLETFLVAENLIFTLGCPSCLSIDASCIFFIFFLYFNTTPEEDYRNHGHSRPCFL